MVGTALALMSSVCGGSADFIGGLQTRRIPLLTVLLGSQLTALLLATLMVAVTGNSPPHSSAMISAALGGAAIALALACLYRALAIGTMMITAPIASAGAVLPVVVGFADGAKPGFFPSVGIATALIGVVLASRGRPGTGGADSPGDSRSAIALALLSACAFGAFFVSVNSAATSGGAAWTVLVSRASFVALLLASTLAVRPPLSVRSSELKPLVAIGILDFAAVSLFAFASRNGLLSVISLLASFPPLVTVVLARLILNEHIRRDQVAGVALTLIGVCFIAAG